MRLPLARAKALANMLVGAHAVPPLEGLAKDPAVKGIFAAADNPQDWKVLLKSVPGEASMVKFPKGMKVQGVMEGPNNPAAAALDNEVKNKLRVKILQMLLTGGGAAGAADQFDSSPLQRNEAGY